MKISELADRVKNGGAISADDALWLATEADFDELLFHANLLRRHFCGDRVKLCAIINAKSGACGENCKFCAQSARHKTQAAVYPFIGSDKVVDAAREAAGYGAECFGVVTSGESACRNERDFDEICKAASGMAEFTKTCTSIGSLDVAHARRLKDAGVWRVHHNLETSEKFFPEVCTTHTYAERVSTIRAAKEAGLQVCAGGLFGLGESWADRVDLALALRELGIDSVPINFLVPIAGTPMAASPLLAPREALRIIALFRFVLGPRQIQICGGRTAVLRDLQSWIFAAGASGVMTGNYLTTTGRSPELDRQMITDLGLSI